MGKTPSPKPPPQPPRPGGLATAAVAARRNARRNAAKQSGGGTESAEESLLDTLRKDPIATNAAKTGLLDTIDAATAKGELSRGETMAPHAPLFIRNKNAPDAEVTAASLRRMLDAGAGDEGGEEEDRPYGMHDGELEVEDDTRLLPGATSRSATPPSPVPQPRPPRKVRRHPRVSALLTGATDLGGGIGGTTSLPTTPRRERYRSESPHFRPIGAEDPTSSAPPPTAPVHPKASKLQPLPDAPHSKKDVRKLIDDAHSIETKRVNTEHTIINKHPVAVHKQYRGSREEALCNRCLVCLVTIIAVFLVLVGALLWFQTNRLHEQTKLLEECQEAALNEVNAVRSEVRQLRQSQTTTDEHHAALMATINATASQTADSVERHGTILRQHGERLEAAEQQIDEPIAVPTPVCNCTLDAPNATTATTATTASTTAATTPSVTTETAATTADVLLDRLATLTEHVSQLQWDMEALERLASDRHVASEGKIAALQRNSSTFAVGIEAVRVAIANLTTAVEGNGNATARNGELLHALRNETTTHGTAIATLNASVATTVDDMSHAWASIDALNTSAWETAEAFHAHNRSAETSLAMLQTTVESNFNLTTAALAFANAESTRLFASLHAHNATAEAQLVALQLGLSALNATVLSQASATNQTVASLEAEVATMAASVQAQTTAITTALNDFHAVDAENRLSCLEAFHSDSCPPPPPFLRGAHMGAEGA